MRVSTRASGATKQLIKTNKIVVDVSKCPIATWTCRGSDINHVTVRGMERMKGKEEAGTCLDVNKVFLVVAIDILEWK